HFCFFWCSLQLFTTDPSIADYELLLSSPVCFLSGSRELPSNKSLFFIPSLIILCRILCWA
uniref:Uncharacterized protein n=1 Tax=Nothoprocta perdicaria TaxID=30464 RepID=A0A8C7EE52_NOTPE